MIVPSSFCSISDAFIGLSGALAISEKSGISECMVRLPLFDVNTTIFLLFPLASAYSELIIAEKLSSLELANLLSIDSNRILHIILDLKRTSTMAHALKLSLLSVFIFEVDYKIPLRFALYPFFRIIARLFRTFPKNHLFFV